MRARILHVGDIINKAHLRWTDKIPMSTSEGPRPHRLLLVEDNPGVAVSILSAFADDQFAVAWKQDLESATLNALDPNLDLILLDRSLPDGDGIHFLRDLRDAGVSTPVIVISASTRVSDILHGLDSGADDYLPKPFMAAELMSRCSAVLRRGRTLDQAPLSAGNLRFGSNTQSVEVNGRPVILARRQLRLLAALLQHKGRPCPRQYLQSVCSGPDHTLAANSLEANVCRLRIALQEAGADVSIRTVRGLGYMLALPALQEGPRMGLSAPLTEH